MATQIQLRQQEISAGILSARNSVKSLLSTKERADHFMAASFHIATDPALASCSAASIINALIGIAQLDLNPDKNLGQAYLVPFRDSVQLQIGYRGFVQLLFRAGWLVKAFPVYSTDQFSIEFDGWDNKVSFVPDLDGREEDNNNWVYQNIRGVFVVARNSTTGDEYSDFVSKKIIEKSRMKSQNQKNAGKPEHIWADWYAEMAKKTAIKKLAKMLPLGDDRASYGIRFDDKGEIGESVDYKKTAETGVIIEGTVTDKTDFDINSHIASGAATVAA
jgi:recombination protein RecT